METRAREWKLGRRDTIRAALLAILVIFAAACGAAQPSQPQPSSASLAPAATSSPTTAPQLQDCTIISLSVPTKYVCNGKVYTSNELRQLREAGQGASGSSGR